MHPVSMVTYYIKQNSFLDLENKSSWLIVIGISNAQCVPAVNVNMPLVAFEAAAASTDVTQ